LNRLSVGIDNRRKIVFDLDVLLLVQLAGAD
jgi:hypothetical protein